MIIEDGAVCFGAHLIVDPVYCNDTAACTQGDVILTAIRFRPQKQTRARHPAQKKHLDSGGRR